MVGLFALPLLLAASSQAADAPNRVRSSGNATVYADADVASVGAYAEGQGEDEASANGALERLLQAWSRAARPFARGPKGLTLTETSRYSQGGNTGLGGGGIGSGGPAAPRVYHARGGVTVEDVDLGRLSALFAAVAGVKGVSPSVSYSVRDAGALRKRALREAFLDARRKAQESAEAAGMRLGEPYLVDAGNGASLTDADRSGEPYDATKPARTHRIVATAAVQVEFRLLK